MYGNFHKDDDVLTDSLFYTEYKYMNEHPDNCFNMFLILHKLGLISIYDRHAYSKVSRRAYAFTYLKSELKDWYRVPKTTRVKDSVEVPRTLGEIVLKSGKSVE